jgi:hypothetical protein
LTFLLNIFGIVGSGPLLFREMEGRILDAGVGTGRNFAFYPRGAKIVGIDGR